MNLTALTWLALLRGEQAAHNDCVEHYESDPDGRARRLARRDAYNAEIGRRRERGERGVVTDDESLSVSQILSL